MLIQAEFTCQPPDERAPLLTYEMQEENKQTMLELETARQSFSVADTLLIWPLR